MRHISAKSIVTSKGRATIPKDIRDRLGLKPGDRITFTMMSDGTVQMRAKNKTVMALAGSLRKAGQKRVPTEQLSH